MCELFGISAKKDTRCDELLKEFFSHGTIHPHGWGIAYCRDKIIEIKKEAVASNKSTTLKTRLQSPVYSDLLLAHIRLATKGNIEYNNTHPFIRRDASKRSWALIHNGTIFESDVLTVYTRRQIGTTDSERILYHLIEKMNNKIKQKGDELSEKERSQVVEELMREISHENKTNLIISDGELLYAHMNYKDSLYQKQKEGAVVLSTKPLDDDDWRALELNTLLVYKHGELFYTGKKHEFEYIDDPEKMKYLYLDFAAM